MYVLRCHPRTLLPLSCKVELRTLRKPWGHVFSAEFVLSVCYTGSRLCVLKNTIRIRALEGLSSGPTVFYAVVIRNENSRRHVHGRRALLAARRARKIHRNACCRCSLEFRAPSLNTSGRGPPRESYQYLSLISSIKGQVGADRRHDVRCRSTVDRQAQEHVRLLRSKARLFSVCSVQSQQGSNTGVSSTRPSHTSSTDNSNT